MPRTYQITVPSERTDDFAREISRMDGVISLRCERGISLQPLGDVLTVGIANQDQEQLMRWLDKQGLGTDPCLAVTMTEPAATISLPHRDRILRDSSEATWEEMESMLSKESNMTLNSLLVMFIAGVLSVAGIASNALHVAIAAMLIAPGFEPLSRIGLGIVASRRSLCRGLIDAAKGYSVLLLGAILTTWLGLLLQKEPLTGSISYYAAGGLLAYFTSVTSWSIIVSIVASAAGALLVASDRSVLTGGVMIGLALIPTLAIVGMGLAEGEWGIAGAGLLRWSIEVLIVTLVSTLVFLCNRFLVTRRKNVL